MKTQKKKKKFFASRSQYLIFLKRNYIILKRSINLKKIQVKMRHHFGPRAEMEPVVDPTVSMPKF